MNLTDLDETLVHQAPLPFEYAATSDHRFFDRHMMSAFAADGGAGLTVGMGLYKNMNVLDGFAAVQHGAATQHNLRLSRGLRPDFETRLGGLRMEIVKPFQSLRYVLEPGADHPHAFDVTFTAFLPPHLEDPHYGRVDGRLATDYLRYCQSGHLNGTLAVAGKEIPVRNWYTWRDHSWGVRPNVGGFDPFTGTGGQGTFPSAIRSGGKGLMLFGFGFATPEFGGYLSLIENGLGERLYITGHLGFPAGANLKIVDAEYDVAFVGRTRDFSEMTIRFKTEDGQSWESRNEAVGRTWIFKGLGYDGGYNDGKGQGVYRAVDGLHREVDAYDVREIGKAKLADGTISKGSHREQHCRTVINGVPGDSYIPLIFIGQNYRYSFD